MAEEEYKCKYCGKEMRKYDYETYKGYCGKCREVIDWKQILSNLKDYEK
jgi:transcription initiation factor TFIIIB Brf1 subunit/transcription initiation factor TFIIB